MSFQKLAMWFRKRDVNNVEKNEFQHSQCVVLKRRVGLYVESKLTNVESKLLLQLLLCRFDICMFLFDRTAKVNPTEVSTCRGSFGGFESTCFQLDRAARIKTTGISYFSCNRTPVPIMEGMREDRSRSEDYSTLHYACTDTTNHNIPTI